MSDERKIIGYDMMTGEPIYEEVSQEVPVEPAVAEPVAAEPATTESVVTEPVPAEPVAVEPVMAEPVAANQEFLGYDPMTGQPIYGQPQQAAPAPQEKKKGKVPVIILSVIAGVVVLALLAVVGVKSGLFLSKGNKVAIATANTLSGYYLKFEYSDKKKSNVFWYAYNKLKYLLH